jgi:hypothetical protein
MLNFLSNTCCTCWILAEGIIPFDTACTVNDERRLLSRMVRNLIGIHLLGGVGVITGNNRFGSMHSDSNLVANVTEFKTYSTKSSDLMLLKSPHQDKSNFWRYGHCFATDLNAVAVTQYQYTCKISWHFLNFYTHLNLIAAQKIINIWSTSLTPGENPTERVFICWINFILLILSLWGASCCITYM